MVDPLVNRNRTENYSPTLHNRNIQQMWLVIIILLIFLLFSHPRYGYNRGWGYGPMGGVGLILLILLILLLFGAIPHNYHWPW